MAKKITLKHDCLDCSKYIGCKKEEKGVNFICKKFEERVGVNLDFLFDDGGDSGGAADIDMSDVEGENKKKKKESNLDLENKQTVFQRISAILDSDLLTPIDTKIDDSSVPAAKNFFQFTTGQKFLNVKPYLFQMMYIIQLFSEYCPRCSDMQYMNHTAKVDDSLAYFSTKVVCLEHGVCPNCGVRRSELIRNGEIHFYQELAGLAGQRCVTGESLVYVNEKYQKIESVCKDFPEGFTDYEGTIRTPLGMRKIKKVFVGEAEPTKRITLENGISIAGTYEHPVMTESGYMPLAAIAPKTLVEVTFGSGAFGSKKVHPDEAALMGRYFSGLTVFDNTPKYRRVLVGQDYCLLDNDLVWKPTLRSIEDCYDYSETSAILFLREFLPWQQGGNSQDVINLVCFWLQSFGVPFYVEDTKVFVDQDYCATASMLFATELRSHKKIYRNYRFNVETKTFLIPVADNVENGNHKSYDFVVDDVESFIANGIDNHNSGKSAIVAMCCAYLLHRQIKIQNPNEIYGLLQANVLHGTFVALTYKQAAETLWEPFLSYITDSPWFCVDANSKVSLRNGLKKSIRDIVPGDVVKTHTGYGQVNQVFDSGEKDCVKIVGEGLETIATKEHKFARVTPDDDFEWVKASELKAGDIIVVE